MKTTHTEQFQVERFARMRLSTTAVLAAAGRLGTGRDVWCGAFDARAPIDGAGRVHPEALG